MNDPTRAGSPIKLYVGVFSTLQGLWARNKFIKEGQRNGGVLLDFITDEVSSKNAHLRAIRREHNGNEVHVYQYIFPLFDEDRDVNGATVVDIARWIFTAKHCGVNLDGFIAFHGTKPGAEKHATMALKNTLGVYNGHTPAIYTSIVPCWIYFASRLLDARTMRDQTEQRSCMLIEEELYESSGDVRATTVGRSLGIAPMSCPEPGGWPKEVRRQGPKEVTRQESKRSAVWVYFEDLASQLLQAQRTHDLVRVKKLLARLGEVANDIEETEGKPKAQEKPVSSRAHTLGPIHREAREDSRIRTWQAEQAANIREHDEGNSDTNSEHGYCFTIADEHN